MILNFSIKNFRSFANLNTLSFESVNQSEGCLDLAVIFGPNASGKTNILKALQYMHFAMQNLDAINKTTLKTPLLQPFLLNSVNKNSPAFFELSLLDTKTDTKYRYGFEVNGERIVSEWLIETANRGKKVTTRELFTRDKDQGIVFDNNVPGEITRLQNNIHESILALPFLANNNFSTAQTVINLFMPNLVILNGSVGIETIRDAAMKRYLEDESLKAEVLDFIKDLDVGIKDIKAERTILKGEDIEMDPVLQSMPMKLNSPTGEIVRTQVMTTHNLYNGKGKIVGTQDLDFVGNESMGTQKLLPFITMLIDSINQGFTVVVDEFGSSFHPFMTAALVKKFSSNNHKAQLILLTHETYLLNKKTNLKRESVWFVDKNNKEESELISLAEYKPRDDARYDKQYLEGRFGAVPIMRRDK